jgi:hypothetical protein
MLRMMGGAPDAAAEHDHSHHAHEAGHSAQSEQKPTSSADDHASHDHDWHHP